MRREVSGQNVWHIRYRIVFPDLRGPLVWSTPKVYVIAALDDQVTVTVSPNRKLTAVRPLQTPPRPAIYKLRPANKTDHLCQSWSYATRQSITFRALYPVVSTCHQACDLVLDQQINRLCTVRSFVRSDSEAHVISYRSHAYDTAVDGGPKQHL